MESIKPSAVLIPPVHMPYYNGDRETRTSMSDPSAQIETLRYRIEVSDKIFRRRPDGPVRLQQRVLPALDQVQRPPTPRAVPALHPHGRTPWRDGRTLEDPDATENIVRWINRTYNNEETNHDSRVTSASPADAPPTRTATTRSRASIGPSSNPATTSDAGPPKIPGATHRTAARVSGDATRLNIRT